MASSCCWRGWQLCGCCGQGVLRCTCDAVDCMLERCFLAVTSAGSVLCWSRQSRFVEVDLPMYVERGMGEADVGPQRCSWLFSAEAARLVNEQLGRDADWCIETFKQSLASDTTVSKTACYTGSSQAVKAGTRASGAVRSRHALRQQAS